MNTDRKIIHVLILISALFLSLTVYLTYFELFEKEKIITNSYNRRQYEAEEKTLRGNIYDRNGTVLAKSVIHEGRQERIYPYGLLYSHVIGYNSKRYGKSLIEARFNAYLLGTNESSVVFNLKNKLTGSEKEGNDLYLTIDHKLQAMASKLMGNRKGSVVALDPKTGEILAMVSKPDFDPSDQKLEENWNRMVEDQEAPFLTRAIQGLYVPGSTYKVVVSTAAIEKGLDSRSFEDKGVITIDGKKISNAGGKAYGKINLKTALAVSSNTAFAQIGTELGADNLKDVSDRFGIGKDIPFDLPVSQSSLQYKNMSKTDMAAVGIGQGKILVTPLHMALISSAVANNGVMMKPLLVSRVITHGGVVLKSPKPTELYQVMSPETASALRDMMREVVEKGTGKNAAIRGVKVAGKTGTAENELTAKQKNKEHAWFIGFAPADNPQIAVAVILEYSGSSGGRAAAPIARDLMSSWLDGKHIF